MDGNPYPAWFWFLFECPRTFGTPDIYAYLNNCWANSYILALYELYFTHVLNRATLFRKRTKEQDETLDAQGMVGARQDVCQNAVASAEKQIVTTGSTKARNKPKKKCGSEEEREG